MSDQEIIKRTPSKLDQSFLSIWLLGITAFFAIATMLFCGWRIFLLEGEARELARERLLLERDRDEFLTYGSELPQMSEQHKAMQMELRQFEVRHAELKKEVANLEDKRGNLGRESQDLLGAVTELRAQAEAATGELGRIKAEMARLGPQKEAATREVAELEAREKLLVDSIAEKQKQEAILAANVEGMERQKSHTQQLLARMADDRQRYADFEKTVTERLARFDSVLDNASNLNGKYGERLEDLAKARTGMLQGLEALNVDLQGLSAYLETVKKDRAAWMDALSETADKNKMLQVEINNVAANGKKLAGEIEASENARKTFQATLLTEAAIINRMASEDAGARAQLAEIASSLGRDQQALKALVAQIKEDSSQIRTLMASQQGEVERLAESSRALANQFEKGKQGMDASLQASVSLSHTAVALTDQINDLKSRLKQADARSGTFDELLGAHSDRLKTLTALARELSSEIDESRRQGMRFQDAIYALHALLKELRESKGEDEKGKADLKTAD